MRLAVAWLEGTLLGRIRPDALDDVELWLAGEDRELQKRRNDAALAGVLAGGGEIA